MADDFVFNGDCAQRRSQQSIDQLDKRRLPTAAFTNYGSDFFLGEPQIDIMKRWPAPNMISNVIQFDVVHGKR